MEKRIGTALIMIGSDAETERLNAILTKYGKLILSRQGLNFKDRDYNIISLVIEATTDEFSALTGNIGRLKGIKVKSLVLKNPS